MASRIGLTERQQIELMMQESRREEEERQRKLQAEMENTAAEQQQPSVQVGTQSRLHTATKPPIILHKPTRSR